MSDKFIKTGHEWHKTDGTVYDAKRQFVLYEANCGKKLACTLPGNEPVDAKSDDDLMCPMCAAGHVIPSSMQPKP